MVLLRNFLAESWITLDKNSTKNKRPKMKTIKTLPLKRAMVARVAPKERDPTSPRKTLAGYTLKYRKAMMVPIQMPIKVDSGVSIILTLITK